MDEMNANEEAIENHLLFYKSLMRSNTDMEDINRYLEILHDHDESKIKLENPVDEGIRTAMRLVRDSGMDPWAIDIHEFVKLYTNRINKSKFDIIVAGKLLVLAWDVVRLQSEETKLNSEKATRPECDFGFNFEPELFQEEKELLYVPDFEGGESVGREPTRPATMLEILEVIDEAAEDYIQLEERERADRERREQRKEAKKFRHQMDAELDESDIGRVWERIQKIGAGEFSIKDLYTTSARNNITVFLSVLHLVFRGYLDVTQDDLLNGEIKLSIVMDNVNTKIEQKQEIEVV